jgi:hypothetical protein
MPHPVVYVTPKPVVIRNHCTAEALNGGRFLNTRIFLLYIYTTGNKIFRLSWSQWLKAFSSTALFPSVFRKRRAEFESGGDIPLV